MMNPAAQVPKDKAKDVTTKPDVVPCSHPLAFGGCWFAQIAAPCGYACKWAISSEDVGR